MPWFVIHHLYANDIEVLLRCCCRVSGSRFAFFTNEGPVHLCCVLFVSVADAAFDVCVAALLELALVNWAVQKLVSRGFVPILPPDLVKFCLLLVDVSACRCMLSANFGFGDQVRHFAVEGCGFQPRGAAQTQIYSVF